MVRPAPTATGHRWRPGFAREFPEPDAHPVPGLGRNRGCGEDAQLLEQIEVFESAPVLEYPPVCDTPDLMAHHGCPPRGRRDVRERAEVCAAGDDAGHDLVVLSEHIR